ncbi:hypothetical protein HMPREF9946_02200 [Acetobacteraceae bacterium AT-5844]|nr:hypothetical protein HMPREF9946_02200 [Acetobacteraceae bacterium AT-5844]
MSRRRPETIVVSPLEARLAYQRNGDPVPANLRWSWPRAAAAILSLAAVGWLGIGMACGHLSDLASMVMG